MTFTLSEARAIVQAAAAAAELDGEQRRRLDRVAEYLADLEARLGDVAHADRVSAGPATAQAELSALVGETEQAAETILVAAEAMLAGAREGTADLAAIVRKEAMTVLEACSFQDIAGQRASKASRVLRDLDAGLAGVAQLGPFAAGVRNETAEERRIRELILHGPALDGPEVSQDAIDAILSAD